MNILVAFFSASGITKEVAQTVAKVAGEMECVKQNIDASSLTEREKKEAKESVDKVVHEIALKFKNEMMQFGRIIKRQ